MKNFFLTLLLLALLPAGAFAHPLNAGDLPETSFVARITFHGQAQLTTLTTALDVWEVHPQQGYLLAAITPEQAADLQQRGYALQMDTAKTALLNHPPEEIPYQTSGIPGYPCYRTVEETYTSLSTLAAAHPDLAQWIDIGDSWEKTQPGGNAGYDIQALVLTNQNIPGPKPKFFLMAAIHARELTTAETATRFAEYLLNNYGSDPEATWLLDFTEVHIVPQANPDGRKMAESGEYWRKNTDNDDGCTTYPDYGTDLNRNSSFMWGGSGASDYACSETYRGPSSASEPEVQAIQNYVSSIFPDQRGSGINDPAPNTATGTFITLHSYSELVLWPWGFDYPEAPNHTQLQTLGRKFAYFNGYEPSQSSDLYPASGTTDDWAYGELGIAAYTFELGTSFFQSCSTFESTIYPDNFGALLYAAKASHRPYQSPAGPEVLNVTVVPTTTVPGAPLTISAQANDTRYGTLGGIEPSQNVTGARFSVDAPSWITGTLTYTLQPTDGAWNSSIENVSGQFNPSGLGLTPGKHTLFVEAQDAQGTWGVPSAVFFWMPDYGFSLSPLESVQYGLPGSTLTYTLHLTNTATLSDTYLLTPSGGQWASSVPTTTGVLLPGEHITLPVVVNIPPQAPYGSDDTLQVVVVSQGNAAAQGVAALTSIVADYQPALTVSGARHLWGSPAETLTYTLRVQNQGNLPETFIFSASPGVWTLHLPVNSGDPLPPTKSRVFQVAVDIPATALPGEGQTFTVTATSTHNPMQHAAIALRADVPLYSVQASLQPDVVSGLPDTTLSTTLRLTNTGDLTDTYALTWTGGTWPLSAPAMLTVSPGATQALSVTVDVPPHTLAGASQTWTATLQGQGAPFTLTLTAQAEAQYGLLAAARLPDTPAYPGTTLSGTLFLTSTANTTQTLRVVISGTWSTNTPVTLTLGAWQSTTVPLVMSIPAGAAEGMQGQVQASITVQGGFAPDVKAHAQVSVVWRRVYLPVLQR